MVLGAEAAARNEQQFPTGLANDIDDVVSFIERNHQTAGSLHEDDASGIGEFFHGRENGGQVDGPVFAFGGQFRRRREAKNLWSRRVIEVFGKESRSGDFPMEIDIFGKCFVSGLDEFEGDGRAADRAKVAKKDSGYVGFSDSGIDAGDKERMHDGWTKKKLVFLLQIGDDISQGLVERIDGHPAGMGEKPGSVDALEDVFGAIEGGIDDRLDLGADDCLKAIEQIADPHMVVGCDIVGETA